MITFLQYAMLFAISALLSGFFVLAYDNIVVGKVPFKLLERDTIREILYRLDIDQKQTFIDLGCGDGRVLIEATKLHPSLKYTGMEKAIFPFLLAKFKTRNYQNIQIIHGDIKKYNFTKYNIVFVYLLPDLLNELVPGIQKAMKSGNKLISVQYKPDDLKAQDKYSLTNKSKFADRWYLYSR